MDKTAVVEDANWRQRIHAETEAAERWTPEWGFMLSQNDAKDLSFTERARSKLIEAETEKEVKVDSAAKAQQRSEKFLNTWKKTNKAFPKEAPQEVYSRPMLTSHDYGWRGGTLEKFGRLTCKLR